MNQPSIGHTFEQHKQFARICAICGREQNDYEFHLIPSENVTESGQAIMNAGKVIYYICHHLTGLKVSDNYCEPCKMAMCDACAVAHKHQPGVMRIEHGQQRTSAEAIEATYREIEIRNYGHEFVYRSDYDQCSVCNGTHGRDDHAEITRLRAEVARLKVQLGRGGSESYL